MADTYVPIDCGLHDQLEVHALRGDPLDVEFVDQAGRAGRLSDVKLLTWHARGGEEFGIFASRGGVETRIRLDRLREVRVVRL